jgi:hypothetical protein
VNTGAKQGPQEVLALNAFRPFYRNQSPSKKAGHWENRLTFESQARALDRQYCVGVKNTAITIAVTMKRNSSVKGVLCEHATIAAACKRLLFQGFQ